VPGKPLIAHFTELARNCTKRKERLIVCECDNPVEDVWVGDCVEGGCCRETCALDVTDNLIENPLDEGRDALSAMSGGPRNLLPGLAELWAHCG
jgi:hypothetical protein